MKEITPELLAEIAAKRQKRRDEIQRQDEANEKAIQDAHDARLKADDVLGIKKPAAEDSSTSARILNPHEISTETTTKPKKPSTDSDGGLELELTMGASKTNLNTDKESLEEDKNKNQTYPRRSQVDHIGYDPRTNSPEAMKAAIEKVQQRVEREKVQQKLRPRGLGLEQ